MNNCTDAERAFLDAVASGKGINEARADWILSRIPPGLRAKLVRDTAAMMRARAVCDATWKELNDLGVDGRMSKTFDDFYHRVESEAEALVADEAPDRTGPTAREREQIAEHKRHMEGGGTTNFLRADGTFARGLDR